MARLTVRLPNSLHKKLRELAKQEGVSMNQLISAAVAEKLAALMTLEYLEQRAEQGSRKRFRGGFETGVRRGSGRSRSPTSKEAA